MASPLPSSTRFFALPELVDIVLQQVPKKSLLPLQRVNHLFKSRIEQTTSLQEKLCLTAKTDVFNNDPDVIDQFHFVRLNTLIYDIKVAEAHTDHGRRRSQHQLSVVDTLPVPKDLIVSADTSLWWRKEGVCFFLLVPQGLKKVHGTVTPSWRNMYLTHQPVTHVRLLAPCKVSIREGRILEAKTSSKTLRNPTGIKISDVLDVITGYADTEYLQMAPYAVQCVYSADFDQARRQYKTRLHEHLQDWKTELGLCHTIGMYQVRDSPPRSSFQTDVGPRSRTILDLARTNEWKCAIRLDGEVGADVGSAHRDISRGPTYSRQI